MNIEDLINKSEDELTKEECLMLASYYDNQSSMYTAFEQAVKLNLNSIYGAFGNKHFFFFNVDIAAAITTQGKDAILYTESIMNKYSTEIFKKDKTLHNKMGFKPKNIEYSNCAVYIDTDSVDGKTKLDLGYYNDYETYKGDNFTKFVKSRKNIEDLYADIKAKYTISSNYKDYKLNIKYEKNLNDVETLTLPKNYQFVLNYKEDKGFYYAPIKKIIRHRVTKDKYEIKTENSRIVVTDCHSCVVWRNNKKIELRPSDIQPDDLVLTYGPSKKYKNITFEKAEVNYIGKFEDVFVYDIEVDDETHTFIGNGILVHNSNYLTFEQMYENSIYEDESKKPNIIQYIHQMYEYRLKNYIIKGLEHYSEKTNSDNMLNFELETISHTGLWLAKKNYILNIAWNDKLPTDKHFESLSEIKVTGFDTVKSSTPTYVRGILKNNIINIVMKDKPSENLLFKITNELAKLQKEFKIQDVSLISNNVKTNNIEKYILSDKGNFAIGVKTPANVKAAGYYNFILNENPEYKRKYDNIFNGEKIKVYKIKSQMSDVFAFKAGSYPYEFAPEMDYEGQFEKTVIVPVNRILTACKLQNIGANLMFSTALF